MEIAPVEPSFSRCPWAGRDPLMQAYHDDEWGVPVRDSRQLWEMLMLEGFQAGLSWSIILKRRDAFRAAFQDFDPQAVAHFDEGDISRLLKDPGIIRSRAKIQATIRGARIFMGMQEAGDDFAAFAWSFVDHAPSHNMTGDVPAKTSLSEQISKTLKQRGFQFVGPTITYAWMQAVGLVNDHVPGCFRHRDAAVSATSRC